MKEIYFVRHGQTEWNSIRKLQGVQDSPLTDEGVDQTSLLAQAIADIPFEICFTSPLGRARQTASILIQNRCPIVQDDFLMEMGFGSVEGLEKEEFKKKYPEEFYNLWHHADKYSPTAFDGESFQSVEERSRKFLEKLRYIPEQKIIVVGHGMLLKTIFGIIWGHSLNKFWDDPVPLNTSITKVHCIKSQFEIVDFSNVSHLPETETISYV